MNPDSCFNPDCGPMYYAILAVTTFSTNSGMQKQHKVLVHVVDLLKVIWIGIWTGGLDPNVNIAYWHVNIGMTMSRDMAVFLVNCVSTISAISIFTKISTQ